MTNKSKEITYFSLFLQVLFGCIYPDMCIAYSFGFAWLHFSGHVYCIHFGFVFFGSLYIQVIQGVIHCRTWNIRKGPCKIGCTARNSLRISCPTIFLYEYILRNLINLLTRMYHMKSNKPFDKNVSYEI
jgi:hypothetical protein